MNGQTSPPSSLLEQPSSPFLGLPRELRNKIYRSILVQDVDVTLRVSCPDYQTSPLHKDDFQCDYIFSHYKSTKIPDLQILRVNR
jgi:hypothetical protein